MKNTNTFTAQINTIRRGVGFVPHPHNSELPDIRIEGEDLNTALNRDMVEVCLHSTEDRREPRGEVVKVVKRARTQFVGRIEIESGLTFLVPDDKRMYTDILITEPPKDAQEGYKAVAEITKWTDPKKDPLGRIVRVLGKKGEHEVEIASIVLEYNIDTNFPDDVLKESKDVAQNGHEELTLLPPASADMLTSKGVTRRDFRTIPTYTIDPADAKDFDDALSFSRIENDLYEIGIHIADVSHYVRTESALDKEAQERGFSTYLVDRTIPMLPEALSNDLCSLNPKSDRFTFSAVVTLDEDGVIHDSWLGKGIIHSDTRFAYEDAQKIIDNEREHEAYIPLTTLNTIAKKLRKKRFDEGAIDFDKSEVQVDIDTRGIPTRIYRKTRLDTHKMIEEFMLLANRIVTETIWDDHKKKNTKPTFLYRVHDTPNEEKLETIGDLVRSLGYTFGKRGHQITAQDINTLFEQIDGSPLEGLIKTSMIRSMSRAEYTTKNIGHFGLSFELYTHFTSPIRRYADLLVHRLLMDHLSGTHTTQDKEASDLESLAGALSTREAHIARAERDSITFKQVEYMSKRIGEKFTGIISGVTEWGLYIEEKDTGAEGLVSVRNLDGDYYRLDTKQYALIGEKTGKKYSLGDTVKFKVTKADVDARTLDFILI